MSRIKDLENFGREDLLETFYGLFLILTRNEFQD